MAVEKRLAYDAEFKLKAIDYAKEHGNRPVAREFRINECMSIAFNLNSASYASLFSTAMLREEVAEGRTHREEENALRGGECAEKRTRQGN
ncbi:hypothetical protein TURU_112079 [Turdus rufiventris]|nr:hypothetical protein TURU_112079 [Turdus rufiventris]